MKARFRSLLASDRGRPGLPTPESTAATDEDRRYLTSLYDDTVPLPPSADVDLRTGHPRLEELRAAYEQLECPGRVASRWTGARVEAFLDLRYFRGETLITWHYREQPRVSALKYWVMLRHVQERDALRLLERLEEDGAFGCWTFEYPGQPRVSRDLLESINELGFLERQLELSHRDRFSVLDVGAGYGRLAHRMSTAFPNLEDYCCVDGIAESTFLSEYYLRFREVAPPARVVPLHEVQRELRPGGFDLAVNIHSFSEVPLNAVRWWVELLAGLKVPSLLVVPNDADGLLSLEADGSRRDFAPVLEAVGYRPAVTEPVFDDPAVRELLGVHDRFHLFSMGVSE